MGEAGGGAERKGRQWAMRGLGSLSSPDCTVELEVCYWRERRATGENLTLIFILRWEDVGAQVPTIILGEREGEGSGGYEMSTIQPRKQLQTQASIFMEHPLPFS